MTKGTLKGLCEMEALLECFRSEQGPAQPLPALSGVGAATPSTCSASSGRCPQSPWCSSSLSPNIKKCKTQHVTSHSMKVQIKRQSITTLYQKAKHDGGDCIAYMYISMQLERIVACEATVLLVRCFFKYVLVRRPASSPTRLRRKGRVGPTIFSSHCFFPAMIWCRNGNQPA